MWMLAEERIEFTKSEVHKKKSKTIQKKKVENEEAKNKK
jgi:hypothetical protein